MQEKRVIEFNASSKVLTLRQPWASLVAWGFKSIENRSWETKYRGALAIHAGSGNDGELWEELVEDPFYLWALERMAEKMGVPFEGLRKALPRGAVVAIAELAGCVEEHDSDWFSGPYGFVLKSINRLEKPVPCKGALGLWSPGPEITRQIREEIDARRIQMVQRDPDARR